MKKTRSCDDTEREGMTASPRNLARLVCITSVIAAVLAVGLWCVSWQYERLHVKCMGGSVDIHTWSRSFSFASSSRHVAVDWQEIREIPSIGWQPTIAVTIDELWFGFGFGIEGTRAGVLVVPQWAITGLAILPAVLCFSLRLHLRRHGGCRGFPVLAESRRGTS